MWLSKNASCKTVHIRATRACQWLFLPPLPQQWLLLWVPRHTWSCFLPYALRLFHSAFIPAHPLKLPLGLFHAALFSCIELGVTYWVVMNLPANAGDASSISVLGRSLGGRNGNSLQYPCLGNPMDRGAWCATVHGIARVGHNFNQPTKQTNTIFYPRNHSP